MNCVELKDIAVTALEDMKGNDIHVMDVRSMTSITDFMIVCSGTSSRHVKSLAESVAIKAKAAGTKRVRIESDSDHEWVLVDLNDVVVHVMTTAARAFYQIEDLWEPIKEMRKKSGE